MTGKGGDQSHDAVTVVALQQQLAMVVGAAKAADGKVGGEENAGQDHHSSDHSPRDHRRWKEKRVQFPQFFFRNFCVFLLVFFLVCQAHRCLFK